MRALPFVLAATFAVGCAPRDREVRLGRLAVERRVLDATIDRLEERLIVNQARVRFWNEMRSRHESVSAIACAGLEDHAEEMAAHTPPARPPPKRARVAAATAQGREPAREPAARGRN